MGRWEGDCEFAHENVILDYALEDGREGQLQILHENVILDYVLEDGREGQLQILHENVILDYVREDGREGQLQMRSRECYSRLCAGGGERGTTANAFMRMLF